MMFANFGFGIWVLVVLCALISLLLVTMIHKDYYDRPEIVIYVGLLLFTIWGLVSIGSILVNV